MESNINIKAEKEVYF